MPTVQGDGGVVGVPDAAFDVDAGVAPHGAPATGSGLPGGHRGDEAEAVVGAGGRDQRDDPDLHDESIRFALHLLTNRDALFLFLDHPEVEATNHLAEKAIRPAVINRKTSGGNRTFNGAHAQAVIMSILRTAKQRAISALDVLADMLRAPHPVAHPLMR